MRLLGSPGASLRASTGETSSWRAGAEWGLRLLVLSVLAWGWLSAVRGSSGKAAEVATSGDLAERLARWSTVAAPAQVRVALAYPPPLAQRDWLAALPGVGTQVQWSGAALVPTAVALEPVADPVNGIDLAVAAPAGSAVVLRDELGPFDTVTVKGPGVRVYLPRTPKMVEAAVGPVVAQAPRRDSLKLGRLLLIGHADWEAKFVQAALEERGWKFDAFLAFSPKGEGNIPQGRIGPIDTATYAAVLAMDTVAEAYADRIARYVRSGGGLLLWPPAAAAHGLAALATGASAAVLPDKDKAPNDSAPRSVLALAPLTNLRSDAVVLERQGQWPALAARRIGPGRVFQIGYLNTWRWRMAGLDEDAPAAHRAWLAHLVASVAYAGRQPLPAATADVAPLATLVDRLGPASPPERASRGGMQLGAWSFVLIALALMLEWASRRLRGVK